MNIEIRERTEQINEGMVPEGYKKTNVGIIPEDWEVGFLDENCNITTGSKDTQDKKQKGIYPFFVRSDNVERINSFAYDGEAILTAGDGVGTGKVFHYIKGKFDYHQRVYCLNKFNNINGKFLYYYFSENFIRQVVKYSAKTSVDSVRREMLTKMTIPQLPLQEQETIANILSTWDKAIEKIEKLIKEKEKQKKGLMQKLLTGETRLPGFSGEWEEVKLGDMARTISGSTPRRTNKSYYGGGIPWVIISDMTSQKKYLYDTEEYITNKGFENSSVKLYEADTILYAMYASIGECVITKTPVTSNQAILNINPNETLSVEYLYYYLTSIKTEIKLQGQQGTQSNLNAGMVRNFKFALPPLQEQEAIANILSTADKEIELLNKLLENKKDEKKGLMQLLLTGIVRV